MSNRPSSSALISARREEVFASYKAANARNRRLFLEGNAMATEEYIFPNQMEDANNIAEIFYQNEKIRAISILKKTKVGADGLMLETAKLMTTHSDDEFVISPENVRMITGMSNTAWEKDMIEKAPTCFKDNIFHHAQLKKEELSKMRNCVIFADENDAASGEERVVRS